MSPKKPTYSGEAADQRADAVSIGGNSILSMEQKRAGLPASPEIFTQKLYSLLEALSCRLSLAELCLKEGRDWKAYQEERKERGL